MMKLIRALYLAPRLYWAVMTVIGLLLLGYGFPLWLGLGKVALLLVVLALLADLLMLFRAQTGLKGERLCPEKLSNGDENPVRIRLENLYRFAVRVEIVDEIPHQFQIRDFQLQSHIPAGKAHTLTYHLRPVRRGEYSFGALHVYVSGPLGLFQRRFSFSADKMTTVYPAFLQMRKYELLAISNRLQDAGIKKIRRIGQNREFDQIKDYVEGDDFRTMNWKATARNNHLKVNQFQDEKSQQVYSIIDKGRVMKMPFEGMTLLDYAINAALVISNIAIRKQDKAGLITFNKGPNTTVRASNRHSHLQDILEALYAQKTEFWESDMSRLYVHIRRQITQRSLLLLYTNFETVSSLHRQLPFLRGMAKSHLLVVIFFENTELDEVIHQPVHDTEDVYLQTIGEKFAYEKRQIVAELKKYGIHTILTQPKDLTVNTINKYLELKARGLI